MTDHVLILGRFPRGKRSESQDASQVTSRVPCIVISMIYRTYITEDSFLLGVSEGLSPLHARLKPLEPIRRVCFERSVPTYCPAGCHYLQVILCEGVFFFIWIVDRRVL